MCADFSSSCISSAPLCIEVRSRTRRSSSSPNSFSALNRPISSCCVLMSSCCSVRTACWSCISSTMRFVASTARRATALSSASRSWQRVARASASPSRLAGSSAAPRDAPRSAWRAHEWLCASAARSPSRTSTLGRSVGRATRRSPGCRTTVTPSTVASCDITVEKSLKLSSAMRRIATGATPHSPWCVRGDEKKRAVRIARAPSAVRV